MADMRRDDQKRQHSGPTFEQASANAIALKEGWVTDDEDGAAPAAHGGSAADVATADDNRILKEFAAAFRHTPDCFTDESDDRAAVDEGVDSDAHAAVDDEEELTTAKKRRQRKRNAVLKKLYNGVDVSSMADASHARRKKRRAKHTA